MSEPSATDLAGIPSMNGLTAEEAQFVYAVEVLGLPVRVAAKQSGMPLTMVSTPHLQQARELLKREVRGNLSVTKEDVTFMLKEAYHMGQIIAEPAAMIAAANSLSKLHGLDAPQKLDINITASIDVLKGHVRQMDDSTLATLVGADKVIDGDFYRVGNGG